MNEEQRSGLIEAQVMAANALEAGAKLAARAAARRTGREQPTRPEAAGLGDKIRGGSTGGW